MTNARQFLVWTDGDATYRFAIAHITHVVFTRPKNIESRTLKLFIAGSGQEVHSLTGQTADDVYHQFPTEIGDSDG